MRAIKRTKKRRNRASHAMAGTVKIDGDRHIVRCRCGFKTNACPTAEQARILYSEHIRDVISFALDGIN